MNTKLITLSDYRKNLSSYTREAKEKNLFYIIMVHGKPAFEVRTVREDLYLESKEYKNESWDTFDSPKAFMTDLKKHHNAK
jgi:hypothetical protein